MSSLKKQELKFPLSKNNLELQVGGIFGIPQQWKNTDEANPALFTYVVRMSKLEVSKGKVCPRELTEREKRQNEEKNKKGGKKDSKAPEPTEEEQRARKQEEERQRLRQEEFESLPEEERVFHAAQDVYKSHSVKFDENRSIVEFSGRDCLILQDRVTKDEGDWLYVYKFPAVAEEELAKMKKTKPKTLANANDLNPLVMRAWVDLKALNSKQTLIKGQRCFLEQVQKSPESPVPNLENTYVKLDLRLSSPVLQEKDHFTTQSLIEDPPKARQVPASVRVIEELKGEVGLAIQSLAMEYSGMFWKEINMQEEQRNAQVFLNSKKGESGKRKEQFLYDFNVSGKYKVLKDRIKKSIVHICESKYKHLFEGMKSFNGVKCDSQDQIYSELYDLLVTNFQETTLRMVGERKHELNEVLVTKKSVLETQAEKLLSSYISEGLVERVKRITREYELIGDYSYGQRLYSQYIQSNPGSAELKYHYALYCLKFNLKPVREILPLIEEYLTKQKGHLNESSKIEYMTILLNAGGDNLAKGWVILREVIESAHEKDAVKWVVLGSVVLKQMGEGELSEKYLASAQRMIQELNEKQSEGRQKEAENAPNQKEGGANVESQPQNQGQGGHRSNPSPNEIPSLIAVATYQSSKNSEQISQNLRKLIQELSEYSAFDLIGIILSSLSQGNRPADDQQEEEKNEQPENSAADGQTPESVIPKILKLLALPGEDAAQEVYQISKNHFQSSQTVSEKLQFNEFLTKALLLLISYQSSQSEERNRLLSELEIHLKKSLSLIASQTGKLNTLLRLGFVYSLKREYGNSRACLLKYLEKVRSNDQSRLSGVSYKLIGLASLRCNRVEEAVQSFKHCNLCDNRNSEVWLYMALTYSKLRNFVSVNQALRLYTKGSSVEEVALYQEIQRELSCVEEGSIDHYEREVKNRILESLAA